MNLRNSCKNKAPAGSKLASTVQNNMLYQLPRTVEADELIGFFKDFEGEKERLSVQDYALGLTTLEEVFLNLSDHDKFVTTDQLVRQGSNGKVAPEDVEARDPESYKAASKRDQVSAMYWKTWSYQRRSCSTCCALVLLPTMVMILLSLLSGLFETLKLDILCGSGVGKADCLTQGPDLACLKSFFELTSESTLGLDHGLINEVSGAPFDGVNPNCNSETCFDDLEQIKFQSVPVVANVTDSSAVGSVAYSTAQATELFEWFADNKLNLILIDECQEAYDEEFDSGTQCQDPISRVSCQERIDGLQSTRDYLENQQGSTGPLISLCTAEANVTFVPSADQIADVEALIAERELCLKERFPLVFSTLSDPDGLNIAQTITDIKASKTGSGVLGDFTTELVSDPLLDAAVSKLFFETEAVLSALLVGRAVITGGPVNPIEILTASSKEICSNYDILVDPNLYFNAQLFNDTISNATGGNIEGVSNLFLFIGSEPGRDSFAKYVNLCQQVSIRFLPF